MTPEETAIFAGIIGEGVGESRKGWLAMRCPFAAYRHEKGTDENASFAIFEDGTKSHCFSCGVKGDAWDLLITLWYFGARLDYWTARSLCEGEHEVECFDPLLDTTTYEDEYLAKMNREPKEFAEDWLDTFPRIAEHPYLTERGVPPDVAIDLDLRYDSTECRICFPVRDFHGTLRGLHGRRVIPGGLKYRMYAYQGRTNSEVWLGESWVDFDEPYVIVESVFDLARVYEITRQVITPLTATFGRRKAERLNGTAEAYCLFDNDTAGDRAYSNLRKWTDIERLCKIPLPEGIKDPGECDKTILRGLLEGVVETRTEEQQDGELFEVRS
jgi:DNA primase